MASAEETYEVLVLVGTVLLAWVGSAILLLLTQQLLHWIQRRRHIARWAKSTRQEQERMLSVIRGCDSSDSKV